ncbi:hypothetical protein HPP92_016885 [Vanilla planifolia]|uniref:Uncharacterized protein n=1 Tax=Vanilla planifolia TaxID=51239 RepID=A0A835QGY4_VANPL|nr:hypothetical protein HPP92_016885 [Vanilla planifolia]
MALSLWPSTMAYHDGPVASHDDDGEEQLDGKMVASSLPGSQYDPPSEPRNPVRSSLRIHLFFRHDSDEAFSAKKSVSTSSVASSGFDVGKKKTSEIYCCFRATDKMKASNFSCFYTD